MWEIGDFSSQNWGMLPSFWVTGPFGLALLFRIATVVVDIE